VLAVNVNTPSRIALIAASALFAGDAISAVVASGLSRAFDLDMLALVSAGAIVLPMLIWIGTYLGVRWAPARERMAALGWVLGVLYTAIGIVLPAPIRTHAIIVEMPAAAIHTTPDYVYPLIDSVAAPLGIVVIAIILARGIAKICGLIVPDRA
jgi:hypothetical protein